MRDYVPALRVTAVRLHVNYFQPSFKLVDELREWAEVVRHNSPPATPCDRVMYDDRTGLGQGRSAIVASQVSAGCAPELIQAMWTSV